MKRVWDEQQEARLPPSVELKLRQICESKMQPWPDDDVIRQLAAVSEESAKETLERISTSKSIRTLGGYIKWMIRQQRTAVSSPSPSKTVRSAHVQSPGASSIVPRRLQFGTPGEAFGVVEQPGSCNGSSVAHVQVDERSRGEAVSDRSPYCYGSPLKATGSCSYQRLSTHAQVHERSQGEAFNHLPPVRGQSPYSSGSPMKAAGTSSQRLSGPGQLDDGFQGEAFTVLEQPGNNNNTQSPYSPVKVAHTYSCQSKFDGEAYGFVEQPGSCNGSSVAHVQVDERFRGEAVSDRSPVVGNLSYCYGSPSKATGSCSYQRLSNHAHVDERSQGEGFHHLSPVSGQSPYSSGSPMKAAGSSSQRLSAPVQLDDRFQAFGEAEAFTVLEQPGSNNNTQSPYSPVKVAHTCSCQSPSASVARVQLEKRFQGGVFTDQTPVQGLSAYAGSPSKAVCISPYQRLSSDVIPVQLHPRFQCEGITRSSVIDKPEDHGEAHLAALGELEYRRQFLILSYAGGMKLRDLIAAEAIRHWKDLPMVMFESTVWEHLG